MKQDLDQQVYMFYTEHHKAFYRYALSIVSDRSDAQDIVHSSIEKLVILVSEKGMLPEYSLQFMFRCIKNISIDKFRVNKSREKAEVCLRNVVNEEHVLDRQILISQCFSMLQENQKEAIMLKEFLGYTYREIGKIKGVSLFTIASWYRTGMKQLQTLISKEITNED